MERWNQVDVSGSIRASLDAGYPCRHDERVFSFSVGGKVMNHSFVKRTKDCSFERQANQLD
jgi:hypothetical protein